MFPVSSGPHRKTMTKDFQTIRVTRPADGVDVITIDRPQARNALSNQVLTELGNHLDAISTDEEVRAVVITGGERVFAAGADLKEMADLDAIGLLNDVRPALWHRIAGFPKPLLAAVNGYALGAGCELALHADIVIAGESARFGQPEVNLGIMPGAGGTQRLIRAVGKSRAMKMVLGGEFISGREALECGLAAELTVPELTIERTIALAAIIASKPPLAVRQAKEAVLATYETHLSDGLRFERKAFCLLGASEDRQEGISAFLEKRTPEFKGK
jgi:enoyl-CoA hydratase